MLCRLEVGDTVPQSQEKPALRTGGALGQRALPEMRYCAANGRGLWDNGEECLRLDQLNLKV